VPGITLRTTLIVGFPGETDEDFEELMRFVRDVEFDRVGVFTYSDEEGTHG
jgi:ribosomal protein S12 methylthiotransferase